MGADDSSAKVSNIYDVWVALLTLLKGALWPALVLFVFLVLMTPIKDTIRLIPVLANRTNTVTFGEFKVELTNEVATSADPAVSAALLSIPPDAVRVLMRMASATHGFCGETYDAGAANALVGLNLVTIRDDSRTQDRSDPDKCTTLQMTELGQKTQDFLIDFISEGFGGTRR